MGQLLVNYPEFADELIEFIAGRKQLDRLAGCLRPDTATARPPRPAETTDIWSLTGNAERGIIGDFRLLAKWAAAAWALSTKRSNFLCNAGSL